MPPVYHKVTQRELDKEITTLTKKICCLEDGLQEQIDACCDENEVKTCEDALECITSEYVGPGLQHLTYDGATVSFADESDIQDCGDVDDCIIDKYTGPGTRYLSYDGATLTFSDVAGGSSYPTVTTHADLPAAASVSAPDNIYVVLTSTGTWFINRKEKGLWYSNGVTWTRLGDAQTIFIDDVFQIQDNAVAGKVLTFNVDLLTGASQKQFQDGAGIIAELSDLPSYTFTNVTFGMSPYTVTSVNNYNVFLVNTSGGNTVINLPTAVSNDAELVFKKTSSDSNTVTVNADGVENIDSDTSITILFQNTSFAILSNNTQWWRI